MFLNFVVGVMLFIFCFYKVNDFVDVVGKFGKVIEVDLFIIIL